MKNNLVRELRESIRLDRTYKKGCIYLVGKNALAKGNNKERSKVEYKLGKYLYKNKVQVPEMYSLVNPDSLASLSSLVSPDSHTSRIVHLLSSIERWYIIMERLRGKDIRHLSGSVRKEAIRQYRQEIKKVLELEICPIDSSWGGNAIFNEDGKLYLIDFECWKKGSESELDWFDEEIKSPKIWFG